MRDTRQLHRYHRQAVAIRCDGNWRSHYSVVYQYCKAHGIPMFMGLESAITPVTAVGVGDPRYITEAQVREMIADPLVTLCSHSKNHKALGYAFATENAQTPNCANAAELSAEIVDSKSELEAKFGVSITGMIYPAHRIDMHGYDMLRYAGYKWGCSPGMKDEGDLQVTRRQAGSSKSIPPDATYPDGIVPGMSAPAVWALTPFDPWLPFRITTDGTDDPHGQLANGTIEKFRKANTNLCAWTTAFWHSTDSIDDFVNTGYCSVEDFTTIMDALRAANVMFLSMDEMVDLLMNPLSHWTMRVVDYSDIERYGFNLAIHGHLREPKINSVGDGTYFDTIPAYWDNNKTNQSLRGWRISGLTANTDFVFHKTGGPISDLDGVECGYLSVKNYNATALLNYQTFSHQVPIPQFGQREVDGRIPIVIRFKAKKGTSSAHLQSILACGRLADGYWHGLNKVSFTSHDVPGNEYVKDLGSIPDDGEWHTYQVKWRAIGNADRLYINLGPAPGDAGMHDISDLQIYKVIDLGFNDIPEGLIG